MSYDRETWEEVAFQVYEEMDGSIRSGYYPTGEGLVNGNIAIDYTFGNFPIQPNEDRALGMAPVSLGVLDSHKIAAVEWNSYPDKNGPTAGSRNYMVTAVEYLPNESVGVYNNIYEYTSQNNLQAGDIVDIDVYADWGSATSREVLYADATKFWTTDEMGTGKLTGLYGRVDVVNEPWNGHTFAGEGDLFYAPRVGLYNNATIEEAKVENYFNYLREIGVDPAILKDMTFSGGANEWDHVDGTSNFDGIVLYSYIPAYVELYQTEQGVPVYGSDVEGRIIFPLGFNADNEIYADSENVEDFMVLVISNDPAKDNGNWW